jgi:hypothetical protein
MFLSLGLVDYVIADYLWARAVLLLGPTLATVGMSAQIPMATIADIFIGQPTWLKQPSTTAVTAAGTVAILAGFIGSNWSPRGVDGAETEEGAGDGAIEGSGAETVLEHCNDYVEGAARHGLRTATDVERGRGCHDCHL